MQTVSKTVVDFFGNKYWLSAADKLVKFHLKMSKELICSFKQSLIHY